MTYRKPSKKSDIRKAENNIRENKAKCRIKLNARDHILRDPSKDYLFRWLEEESGSQLNLKKVTDKLYLAYPIYGKIDERCRIWTNDFINWHVHTKTARILKRQMR
jgi:hypothetical protein